MPHSNSSTTHLAAFIDLAFHIAHKYIEFEEPVLPAVIERLCSIDVEINVKGA